MSLLLGSQLVDFFCCGYEGSLNLEFWWRFSNALSKGWTLFPFVFLSLFWLAVLMLRRELIKLCGWCFTHGTK
jgi:hypothetical protein